MILGATCPFSCSHKLKPGRDAKTMSATLKWILLVESASSSFTRSYEPKISGSRSGCGNGWASLHILLTLRGFSSLTVAEDWLMTGIERRQPSSCFLWVALYCFRLSQRPAMHIVLTLLFLNLMTTLESEVHTFVWCMKDLEAHRIYSEVSQKHNSLVIELRFAHVCEPGSIDVTACINLI